MSPHNAHTHTPPNKIRIRMRFSVNRNKRQWKCWANTKPFSHVSRVLEQRIDRNVLNPFILNTRIGNLYRISFSFLRCPPTRHQHVWVCALNEDRRSYNGWCVGGKWFRDEYAPLVNELNERNSCEAIQFDLLQMFSGCTWTKRKQIVVVLRLRLFFLLFFFLAPIQYAEMGKRNAK